ncbi:MAG TPA: deoxyribonuclease IV [Chthonomonadaceae bacterium]|nr:deoxyribonuclease IV [Chthonomonadaceae bacterium]
MASQFGLHIDPPLAGIPAALGEHGLTHFQTTLRDPMRLAKLGIPDEADQHAYHTAAAGGLWGIVHASLITNLASPDPKLRNGSAGALVADANLAQALGLAGVCFHVGYQKGHADRDAALNAVAYKLNSVVSQLHAGARVLLENGAEGTELGQTVDEIGRVVRATGADCSRLGVVLDTCHLHVSGFDMAAPEAPDRLADEIEAAGLTPFLTALHLNDAREPCGSRRDRHAIPGQGTIGAGLRRLLAHPLFAPLPCVLELNVPAALEGIAYMLADDQPLRELTQ